MIRRIIGRMSGGNRPGNCVMYHIGRCGSGVLASLLRQHRNIYWDGEVYTPVFTEWREKHGGVETAESFPEDPVKRLEKRMVLACNSFYGFEIKPFHHRLINCPAETFIGHLDELGFTHFIILDRKNRLRKIMSSIIAHERTGKYHSKKGKEAVLNSVSVNADEVKIDFETKPLLKYLSDYDAQFDDLGRVLQGRNVLKLTYEDDIQDDPEKAYRRVCGFLDLKPKKVSVGLSRTNPFPIREMVTNIEEIEELLSGTPYEWMLKD
ncbi:hypothetical protein ACFL6F_04230 [Planctomycetota bacterium]